MPISFCNIKKPIKSFSEQVTSSDRIRRLKTQILYSNYNLDNPSNSVPPKLNIPPFSNTYQERYDLIKGYSNCNNLISWYKISVSLDETIIFNGYFSMNDTTNEITSFYETISGVTPFNNILAPKQCCNFEFTDNKFYPSSGGFGKYGVNLTQFSYYGNVSPFYNLGFNNQLWKCNTGSNYIDVTMNILKL
jgi:hypothetical protein